LRVADLVEVVLVVQVPHLVQVHVCLRLCLECRVGGLRFGCGIRGLRPVWWFWGFEFWVLDFAFWVLG